MWVETCNIHPLMPHLSYSIHIYPHLCCLIYPHMPLHHLSSSIIYPHPSLSILINAYLSSSIPIHPHLSLSMLMHPHLCLSILIYPDTHPELLRNTVLNLNS